MAEVITRFKVDTSQYDSKIRKAKSDLGGLDKAFGGLGKSLGLNVGALSKFSVGLAAAGAAIKVAGDAFKNSEGFMDSWNASMEGAKSAYTSFLTALNTGDFGSFFSNIKAVVNAARDAYDSLDNLGTYNAFAARANAKNKAAYAEAVANYKENKSAENREAVKVTSDAIIADLETQKELVAKAYIDSVKKLALEQGIEGAEADSFVNMFSNSSWAELASAKAGYSRGKGANAGAHYWNGGQVFGNEILFRNADGSAKERRAMTEAEQAAYKFARALNEVSDEKIKEVQALGGQEFTIDQAIADQRRNALRMLGSGETTKTTAVKEEKATSSTTLGDIALLEDHIKTVRNSIEMATAEDLPEMYAELDRLESKMKMLKEGAENFGEAIKSSFSIDAPADFTKEVEKMNAALKAKEFPQQAQQASDAWQTVTSSVSQLGGALQSIDNEGIQVTGIIAQAIANIVAGFAAANAKQGADGNVWEWIAASVAGVATMITTIASIKSATSGSYASGGIIPGNSYSGDNLTANVNSGELILNRAQQGAIASQLGNNSLSAMHLTTEISGESLLVVMDNSNRRRGGSRGYYTRVR